MTSLGHPGYPTVSRRRLLVGAGLAALTPAARAAEPEPRPWPRGKATPALSLPGDDGQPWQLAAQRGQVLLLNFWASWCEPCRSEMPTLELLAQRHERDRFRVLAVNFRETDAALQRYLAQWPITLPILRDRDGAAAQAFGVRVFPTTVAIGRDGRARFSVVGEADWNGPTARRWIAPLL